MTLGESIQKMTMTELKKLVKEVDIKPSGKKKSDFIAAIDEALSEKLNSCNISELKALAKESSIDLGGKKKKGDIIEVISSSLDPESLSAFLAPAKPEPEEESLEDIGEELVEIEKDVEKVLVDVGKIPTADMADILEIDKKLTDIVKVNVDYANVGSLLDVGRVKFMDGRYMESMKMLHEASKTSKDFFEEYQDVTYAYIILAAEKILEDCADAESNDEVAADALIDAKRAFSEKGARRSESAELLNKIASIVYKEELELLENLMNKRESTIKAIKVQGVDVFNAERYLHRAREVYLVGELANCMTNLEKSYNIANESKNVWVREIENDVPRVESIIKQSSEFGADISDAENYLNKAKTALENEDYSLCAELTKFAERKAMVGQHGQIQKAARLEKKKLDDAQEILTSLSPLVQEAKMYQMDVRAIDDAVNSSMGALQNNDYVNALTYAREAENLAKYLKTQVEAEREKILAAGGDFKECSMCLNHSVKLFTNNWARCMSCGQTFQVVGDKKRKKWGLFGK